MALRSKADFERQQGFTAEDHTDALYSALMFQPRVVGALVALGVILQSPWVFLVLSAVLWWSTLVPTHNPFDAFFYHVMADPQPATRIAPAPRRFAQGLAGMFTLAIGAALLAGASRTAWLVEGLLAGAVMTVVFGRLCAGASVYHLLWSRVPGRQCSTVAGTRVQ
jgi:hypothetical protein